MQFSQQARGARVALFCFLLSVVGIGAGFITTESVMAVGKSRFEKLELFGKVLHMIETQYYRDVDTEKLIQGAIKGMMDTLDPHSSFLGKELFTKMQEDTKGEFGGLGIEVTQKNGIITIITPIDDTPAYKAGLKSGDRIVEINHESTIGMTLEDAVDKMRGKIDSKILVGISRDGLTGIKQYEITRQIIKIKSVKSELIDSFIFIRLTQFQKGAADSIAKAIKKGRKEAKGKVDGIILDLRANPGGLLDEAVLVSSIFLQDGVVVSTEGRDPKQRELHRVKKSGAKELTIPMVVLINGSSASASEIVAGALQDQKRAIIMGAPSFGKGSVQTVAKIDDEKGVKLTIAQYMTPLGRKIQAIGIKPDVILANVDYQEMQKIVREDWSAREKDLRNHLAATIETKQEKKLRLEQEKVERRERVERINQHKKNLKKGKNGKEEEEIYRPYLPAEDYQVLQAIKFLKTFKVYRTMKVGT
ncbi:MAG: PDZ domain-containing protein [Bdellovibrionales bacterium]|jgi:carboxyl-terminal processing protease|nr:PDZ domain-containing protein [Bdellovibrionales bacterium]MBT3525417.1 PDZ domain-containing protein [Bdellovibrionales bacterium]MBT7669949.1 PDZ domain-containing protein [Bdellovibrionales bacterium]MBT7766260.1 PDZ domain-containing protein [Bdellovibrionales bacterium]